MLARLGLAADLNLRNGLPAETGAAPMPQVVIYLELVSPVFEFIFTGTMNCSDYLLQCLDGSTVLNPHRWKRTFPMFILPRRTIITGYIGLNLFDTQG